MPKIKDNIRYALTIPDLIRRFLASWLLSAMVEYGMDIFPLTELTAIGKMSLSRMCTVGCSVFLLLNLLSLIFNTKKLERFLIPAAFCGLWIPSLVSSFCAAYLITGTLIAACMVPYVIYGNREPDALTPKRYKERKLWSILTVLAGIAFFLYLCAWNVGRYITFSSPSYDFGIFSQMFHYMKTTFIPYTSLERNGLLSHFQVHVSPIWYLLLPIYALIPSPATLQVLQAAVLTSALIPLWLITKHQGFSGPWRFVLCSLLLLYPATSGATGYDIHENVFLTPLLLWLFFALEQRRYALTALAALLILFVKEDAAVYVAVTGLWIGVRSVTGKKANRKDLAVGILLLTLSVVWFFLITGYLDRHGDGVMTYRYNNLIADDSGSLLGVIKTVFLCPVKAVYECVDAEKLSYIALTAASLVGMPLLTRRYERLILLIPYLLVNLMSDYRYQHDVFFQYSFGSTAFLIYLCVLNMGDLKETTLHPVLKALPLILAVVLSTGMFCKQILPTALYYPKTYHAYKGYYRELEKLLDSVPEDASVSATTFYTSHLSKRDILYDIRYSSADNIFSAEYIVINPSESGSYTSYGGYKAFQKLLKKEGYVLVDQKEGRLEIYIKTGLV